MAFVQFVKGGRESSELGPLRAAGIRVVRPAVERSGLLRGEATDADRAAAAAAWAAARAALSDPGCDLVVLDELHAALRHRLVPWTRSSPRWPRGRPGRRSSPPAAALPTPWSRRPRS